MSHENNQKQTSLVVQWLRFHLPMQEVWVWSLVSDLRFHMLWGAVKIFLKRKKNPPFSTGVVEIGLRAVKGAPGNADGI